MTNNMSFYGGRPGKPFTITKIFDSYEQLQNDANLSWVSTIPIGDYVLIGYSYNGEELNQDKPFGGTLWQKIYQENLDLSLQPDTEYGTVEAGGRLHYFANGAISGIGYKFISETGNTPQLGIEYEIIAPNEKPTIEAIYKNHGGAKYNFKLPRSSNYYYFDYIEGVSLIDTDGSIKNIQLNESTKIILAKEQTITNINSDDYLGDYFIEKNIGLVYKVEKINDVLTLVFKTKLTVLPEVITEVPNYANGDTINQPEVTLAFGEKNNKLNNNYKFSLPQNPNFNFSVDFASSLQASVIKTINNNDVNYTIYFPSGLRGISNFDIKYIVKNKNELDALKNDNSLNFANLALVGQEGQFTLYIYNGSDWYQLSEMNEIVFTTGNALGEIKQSTAIEEEEENCYNIKVMNDMLSWNGNAKQPKFLSVKEGAGAPGNNVSGELYINTETKELYYEGKSVIQKTEKVIIPGGINPINSQAVQHLEGGQFRFNIPNHLDWIQNQNDKKLWTTSLIFNKSTQEIYKWLTLNPNKTPLISFIEDSNLSVNLDRQQQFDKIAFIDLQYNPNVNNEINIEIGIYTENQQFPTTKENSGLPIVCILPGGKGESI